MDVAILVIVMVNLFVSFLALCVTVNASADQKSRDMATASTLFSLITIRNRKKEE